MRVNLVKHAERELEHAFGKEGERDEYDAMLCEGVLDVVEKFADQGHSGMSASIALAALEKLLDFKNLTPITDDPEDWILVGDMGRGRETWQCRRNGKLFSEDGGKTYRNLDEYRHGWRRKIFGLAPIRRSKPRGEI